MSEDKTDYQSNSHTSKETEKKLTEKTITPLDLAGSVEEKKPKFGQKVKHLFFGGDFKAAASYVAAEVILPGLRNVAADAVKGAVDRTIFGDRHRDRRSRSDMGTRVSYNQPVQRRSRERTYLPDQPPHPYKTNTQEINDLVFGMREDAEAVLSQMYDILETYDLVSLADVYAMVGLPTKYTDHSWGWTELRASSITQRRDGWVIDLPPMRSL